MKKTNFWMLSEKGEGEHMLMNNVDDNTRKC